MIFSIIIPICNGEKYLRESIDSALSQDVSFAKDTDEEPYEVILLENGSSDNSPLICDEYHRLCRNVTAIHKGKIGLYAARQEGIAASKGKWIIALDADDRLRKDALLRLYEAIERYKERGEEPDIILYDAAGFGNSTKRLSERPFPHDRILKGTDIRAFKEAICKDDSINSMWTKCINKRIALLEKRNLFLNYGEDLYQTAEYLDRASGVVYLNEILYYYREDAVSLSSTYSEVYLDNQKITWGKLDEMVFKWGMGEYISVIDKRKSLTCTIAMTKLIYSGLAFAEKKYKLEKLLEEPFYKQYSSFDLPSWAPEESVYVKKLQKSGSANTVLLFESEKSRVKSGIKKLLGRT